jgi:thiosulfate/3-mercaptopyruvate sulfurtransferase
MTSYANPSALVSTEWVAEHLADPAVRLLEVDVDTSAYEQGHLPGAVGLNWTTQLCDQVLREIPSPATWDRLMSACGVRPDMKLVFYGDNNNWFAAYAYWLASMYGHTNLALMNGGRKKWELEGRPLTTEPTRVTPTSYQGGPLDLRCRAYLSDVLSCVDAPDGKALVDVRSPAEYHGEIIAPPGLAETAQRAGHVPGATSIPWALAANDDGSFKSAAELQELYASKGITPDQDVVTYCRIGERSSHSWFVLKELLGFPHVRNYDGSWTEYGSVIGVPIENPAALVAA